MVRRDLEPARYPGFLIYGVAFYTFYCLIFSMIQCIRFRRLHTPIFSAVKRLDLAKALYAIYMLQLSMLAQFGDARWPGLELFSCRLCS